MTEPERHLHAVDDTPRRVFADTDAEQVVLGMMMASPRNIEAAVDLLGEVDFYLPKHATVWSALVGLWGAGQPCDPVLLGHHLAEVGDLGRAGGVPYLHTLMDAVPTAVGTIEHHAQIVKGWSRRRRVREAGMRLVQNADNLTEDVDEVVERAQRTIHDTVSARKTPLLVVGEFVDDEFTYLEDVQAGRVEPGISSGIADLDALLGGWHPGRLVIPAGRPGSGKSVLSLNFAKAALERGYPVLIFPMEMSKREVLWRLLSDWAKIPLHLFQDARFDSTDWLRLKNAREELRQLPLVIDDQVNSVPQITANSRRFAQRFGRPGLIIPDYVQRLRFPGKERRDIEVGDAAKAFKELARELQTTVVAPCQLNRGNEARAEKVPQLSDLRDSGQLEQEADQVILIHRPDYYDKESNRAGEADLIVAKNRHGATDTITVAAQLHFARFVDMAIA